MLKSTTLLIVFGVIILIIIFFISINSDSKKLKVNLAYKRNECNFMMNSSLKAVYAKYDINPLTDKMKAKKIIYMPGAYDDIAGEISKMPRTTNNYYYIINNIDLIVGKDYLWNTLYNYYGDDVTKISPLSYITNDPSSLKRLQNDYKDGSIYIAKKNIQRQEGIQITDNKDEIFNMAKTPDVAVIQELLQDPMTIDGHKINLRVYVLIIVKSNKCDIYVYDDGFMYYTPKKFKKNSIDKDHNITTGYIDREIYDRNPLTHKDFMKYLKKTTGAANADRIKQNIFNVIKMITKPYLKIFVDTQSFPESTQYQIMGADVAINDKGDAIIMEVNKGPDLGGKDKRDTELKCNLVEHSLEIIGALPMSDSNDFVKVI